MFHLFILFKPSIFWRNFSGIQYSSMVRFNSQSSSSSTETGAALQNRIENLLKMNFPEANEIIVKDISGGCGSMFEVYVAAMDFEGMPKVKQHLAISKILKKEIKDMHGIRIFTEVPKLN